ncbi:MAG: hypothetical protein NWF07_07260 [Candidatus Bathyarchaeota archaeon]|nr:hypothetical protein [Candidatus Bathyarchaeota archaeon]
MPEMTEKIDEYLDKFIASDLVLIKIKEENQPINSLKRLFLERIKERGLEHITSYTFLEELFLEKI